LIDSFSLTTVVLTDQQSVLFVEVRELTVEIFRMWNVKTFRKYPYNISGKGYIKEFQETAILGTARTKKS